MAKMTQEELQCIISAEIDDARDYIDEDISPVRANAANYYLGRPFGNEKDGRSKVVSQDVRDTVGSLLPSIMKIFTSSDRVVEFAPTGPEDVDMAEQATDYCNFVYSKDNDGYLNLYHTFKDAMIRKVGIQKIWWEEKKEVDIQEYEGLDESTIAIIMQEPDAEVTDIEIEYKKENVTQLDQMTGQLIQALVDVPVYSCKVKKTDKMGRICVDVLPPEEFLISRTARSLEDASIVAHRALVPVSDLVSMGYNRAEVERRATSEEFWSNEEATERSDYTEMNPGFVNNKAMRKVLYIESYIRVDYDGDGIAERRKICTIGDDYLIVENEPCKMLPFADFTVDSEPHLSCVESTSTADKVMDIQLIKSSILRNSLDSMAQTLNPRTVVLEGKANIGDVLNNEVGALIREQSPGAVRELVSSPIFQQAFPMLDYFDSVKESRTGISKAAAGLDPDALKNTTVNAANFQVSATQSQMELVARNLANGFKRVFRIMLHLMVTHQDKPRIIRLRNKFVPIDPKLWNPRMDVEINVALGRGTDSDRYNVLSGIAAKQEMIMQTMGLSNPLVSLAQYSNTLTKLVELSGNKNTQAYITDLPDNFQLPPPQPQADQNQQAVQMMAQVEREKNQAKFEIDSANLRLKQTQAEAENERYRFELMLKERDLQVKEQHLQLKAAEQQADFKLKEAEFKIKEGELMLKQLTLMKDEQNDVDEKAERQNQANAEARAQEEGLLQQTALMLNNMTNQGKSNGD